MAFAVICKSCQARFLLNDDLLRRKVAGRVVTVRCRQCHAPIEVDASQVDASPAADTAIEPEPPGPPPALAPVKATLSYKPAPSPPRPAKSSTLIGIGGPPRPGAASEMVALSPGLLNMSAPATGPRGFPEPPPPPSTIEDISGDWEIPEAKTPLMAIAESAPESVDDFIEELPPSLPPPAEEEQPSSVGTPALSALVHHDRAAAPRHDDFFANSGDAGTLELGAPTIDVSSFDVPRTGKQTLPLFGVDDEPTVSIRTTDALTAPRPPEGSLSPSSLDRPPVSLRPDSMRSRRNVVAPAAKSDPPPGASPRRSVLALPVLLVLAAAAGFLIWKRGSGTDEVASATAPLAHAPAPTAAPEPAHAAPAEPAAVAAATTTTAAPDDVTFETTPAKPVGKVAAPASEPSPRLPSSTKPAEEPVSKPEARAPAEPVTPAPKEEPNPTVPSEPSEPAGPFDRAAAAAALTAAASAASTCRKDGDPSGTASVVITFAPSGRVTSANLGGPPFAGTPTGGCIAAALRKARVPAFEGERVTVSKTIVVQ
ncbi:MAG: hypothetical protein EOO73_00210 [Myxococcales bacterium]|nr:MAG: hypothetical protein EOO73_00210 [Myxococcales bacterium]